MITKHKSVKQQIKVKATVLRTAQRRLAQLQAENDLLRYQHQLLSEMCKGFDWFRLLKLHALLADPELMQLDSEQLTPDGWQQELDRCLATDDETRLLQQLSSLPVVQTQSSLDCVAALTSALDGATPLQERSNSSSASMNCSSSALPASHSNSDSSSHHMVAPPADPLRLMKYLVSQPSPACCAGVDTMTLQELLAHYKSTVHDLSFQLVQHSAGGIAGTEEPQRKMQAALTEHLQLILQLCSCRSELVTALQLTNSDTGEQVTEPDRQRIGWVVERLELTQQQQHSITRAMSVFRRLLTPVLEELRQLQQQGDACTSPSASNSTSTAADAGGCSGDASEALQQYSSSGERGCVLEQQEQRSGRMKMLLRKDFFLRTWFGSYLYGQLSWVQLARMHVLMVPFYPVPFVFFSEVSAQVLGQLEKHEEQLEDDAADDSPDSSSL